MFGSGCRGILYMRGKHNSLGKWWEHLVRTLQLVQTGNRKQLWLNIIFIQEPLKCCSESQVLTFLQGAVLKPSLTYQKYSQSYCPLELFCFVRFHHWISGLPVTIVSVPLHSHTYEWWYRCFFAYLLYYLKYYFSIFSINQQEILLF